MNNIIIVPPRNPYCKCGVLKDEENTYLRKRKDKHPDKRYFFHLCKDCSNIESEKWAKENPEQYRAIVRKSARKNYDAEKERKRNLLRRYNGND